MSIIYYTRTFLLFITLNFIAQGSLAQPALLNYKPTSWKNKSTWIDGHVPTDTDHVVLINDITIDTNAVCKSLTTNGWFVTVLPGYTLDIKGKDTLHQQADHDTLVSALLWRRYVNEKDSLNIKASQVYKTYEYDSLKRIRLIVTKEDFADNELRFYYIGNSNLPYMTIKRDPCDYMEGDKCVVYADTSYYWYDSLGRMIKDSSQTWLSNAPVTTTRVDNYIYDSTQILKVRRSNSPIYDPSGWHLSAFTTGTLRAFQTMPLLNTFSQQTYLLPVYPGSIFYNYVFSVDQWENPLYRTSIHYPLAPPEQLFFDFPELKNNRTSYSRMDTYGYDSYQLSYRYNSNKLPEECILHSFYNDLGTIYVFSYEYTH